MMIIKMKILSNSQPKMKIKDQTFYGNNQKDELIINKII